MAKDRYRKIAVRMYADDKYQQLSRPQPCGQALWTYLLTGPHTTALPGLFVAGEAGMAECLGWDIEAFRKAFAEVFDKGMAKADWKARVVWIPKALFYNAPESPNVIIGWRKAWDEVPACAIKAEALKAITDFVLTLTDKFKKAFQQAFPEAFAKDFGKTCLNQEQEQEQELNTPLRASGEETNPEPEFAAAVEDAFSDLDDAEPPVAPKEKTAAELVNELKFRWGSALTCLPDGWARNSQFVLSVAKWWGHMDERGKKISLISWRTKVAEMSAWGIERATAAVEYSIGQGYDSIHENRKNTCPLPARRKETIDERVARLTGTEASHA